MYCHPAVAAVFGPIAAIQPAPIANFDEFAGELLHAARNSAAGYDNAAMDRAGHLLLVLLAPAARYDFDRGDLDGLLEGVELLRLVRAVDLLAEDLPAVCTETTVAAMSAPRLLADMVSDGEAADRVLAVGAILSRLGVRTPDALDSVVRAATTAPV